MNNDEIRENKKTHYDKAKREKQAAIKREKLGLGKNNVRLHHQTTHGTRSVN